MRYFLFILTCIVFLGASTPSLAETNPFTPVFSDVILDLPIMPGLTEDMDAAVIFDKEQGRFVETAASGQIKVDTIKLFYEKALPPLGWKAVTGTVFHRDQEVLKLKFEEHNNNIVVFFTLTPQT